jgi:hypothetical protein
MRRYPAELSFSVFRRFANLVPSRACSTRWMWVVSLLLQATKALRESRGIALLCFETSQLEGVRGHRHAPAAFYTPGKTRERPGKDPGGWVGPRAGLDRCGKSCPHRDSIPGPSSP